MRWMRRFQALYRRRGLERDLRDELELHIALKTEANIDAGLSPEEARAAALRSFGGIERFKEACRDERPLGAIDTVVQDVRYGLRQLRRTPGVTLVVILSLALGIGANTAIFSLVNAVMLKALPVQDPDRLALLQWTTEPSVERPYKGLDGRNWRDATGRMTSTSFSYPAFRHLQRRSRSFSSLFAFAAFGGRRTVTVDGQAEHAIVHLVSGNYFSGLGVPAAAGRMLTPADDTATATPVAVINHAYWQRRFGRDPTTVGKTIAVNGTPVTIVGIAPPGFFGVQPGRVVDLWVPLSPISPEEDGEPLLHARDQWWTLIMGGLAPGATVAQARTELDTLFQQHLSAGLATPPPPAQLPHIDLVPARNGLDVLAREFSEPLFILMTVVGLVLLIACANVANLLLARATVRRKEMAMRLALGAGRRRLVRQLVTESLLLAGLGGTLGLLVAYWGTHTLLALMSSGGREIALNVEPDGWVLIFTLVVSVLAGIAFGLTPAFRATSVELTPALKESTGAAAPGSRLGPARVLVVAQVALSLLLLVGAALFIGTLRNLHREQLGFNAQNLLLFGVDPTQNGYKGTALMDLYARMAERLRALPGVSSVTFSEAALLSGNHSIRGAAAEGQPERSVWEHVVGPDFLRTMGIALVRGRDFSSRDNESSPRGVVVNETAARRFFGTVDAVGRRFSAEDGEVIGVAGDAKYDSLRQAPPATLYKFYRQYIDLGAMNFELRTATDPTALIPSVRRAVEEVDKELPLFNVKTQVQQIDETLLHERLFAQLAGFFGGLAVLLACIGLYGLTAYSVARRTSEIGVRMALGALTRDIVWMVLRDAVLLVSAGVIIGLPVAVAASGLIASQLYGVTPMAPLTIGLAVCVLVSVATLAALLPARKASVVSPTIALRYE
jgi:predicted permease